MPQPSSTRPRRTAPLLALLWLAFGSAGCVYSIDIQQGNFLENKDIDQVTVGMTRAQVRYLLGTPIVGNSFQDSRWDYVYYLKRGQTGDVEQRHFTVYFEADKVARIDRRTGEPAATASATR